MCNLCISSFLFLLPLVLLVRTTLAADPIFYICSSTAGSFTPNTDYQTNLNAALGYLQNNLSPSGFARAANRIGPSTFFGIAQCQGEVGSSGCASCVVDARDGIRSRCPNNQGAIIWYDNCLLKYVDQDFFGQIDYSNQFVLVNGYRATIDPTVFNQKVNDFLTKLADDGSNTGKLYATGQTVVDSATNLKLYGLVQCTQDLSSRDCKTCLTTFISELPSCCNAQLGVRKVGGSCNLRYETYPFVNSQSS